MVSSITGGSCSRSFGRIVLQLAVKSRLPDSQKPRRLQFVAVEFGNRIQDRHFLQFSHGNNLGMTVSVAIGWGRIRDHANLAWQIGGVGSRSAVESVGAFQTVFQ